MKYVAGFAGWLFSLLPPRRYRPSTPPLVWLESNHDRAARAANDATVVYGPSHPLYAKESA